MSGTQAANTTFYDRISSTYDAIADAGEHQARETGERLLAPREGECILEIGYGTGNSILSLAKQVGEGGRVVGLDVSDGMRQVAKHKIDAAGLSARVQLDIGDARQLPYAASEFDAAFMSFTLELFSLEDIPLVLQEIRRVLRPGGRLGVVSMAVVPDGESPSLLERTYVWMHRNFPHIVDCQPIDVHQVLIDAGFSIDAETSMEIWTMPVVAAIAIR
jgi:ubiquinone/menaquinone biosynthesis C-methylase UbiE